MAGPWGDHVIEVGACWAVVMALTGYYLFVRGWRARRRARRAGSPGRRAAPPARAGRRRGRPRTAHPAGHRAAVDRLLGREGAVLRDRAGLVDVEPRPGRPERSDLHAGRVAAAQPPARTCRGRRATRPSRPATRRRATRENVANVDTAIAVADQQGLRHPMTVALPAPRRRDRRLLGDRLRLRRARRTSRPCTSAGTAARWSRRTASPTTRCWPRSSRRASGCTRAAASGGGRSGARR